MAWILFKPVASSSHSDYRPDVDGLRALAVLAVVAFHAAPRIFPGGFVGVDIFFVISGYLISRIIIFDLNRGTFSFLNFYGRRVRRIFPALAVMFVGLWALGWLLLLPDEFELLGKHMAAGAAFVVNFVLYNQFDWYFFAQPTLMLHLWSLGVEEQFYLLWPVFLVGVWRAKRLRLTPIVLVAAASFAINIASIRSDPMAAFFLPAGRLWELAIGGALACAQHHGVGASDRARKPLLYLRAFNANVRGVAGAILLAISLVTFHRQLIYPGWWALAPCVGALLLISAGSQSWVNRYVLARRPMVFIGLISYPLYLWHWALLAFAEIVDPSEGLTPAATATLLSVAFALAFLTYRCVELPIRSSQNRMKVTGGLCAVMAACGGIGYVTYVQAIPSRSESFAVDGFIRASNESFWPPGTRHRYEPMHSEGFLPLGNGPRRVVFVGDSNMQQYYPRIQKLLLDHPRNTQSALFAVRDSCALGAVDIGAPTPCGRHLRKAIEYAKQPDVEAVVLGAAWYLHFSHLETLDQFGEPAPLRPYSEDAFDRLEQIVADLVSTGRRVYIVLDIPLGLQLDPRRMVRRTLFPPGFRFETSPPRTAELQVAFRPVKTALKRIARNTGATVIDPMDALCDESICPALTRDGQPMYRDVNHLRPSYVREHVRFLDRTILDTYNNMN